MSDYPFNSAKVIESSINKDGVEITTFEVTCPRFIWAEVMTHRVLSRNAQSSRANPFKKRLKQTLFDPVMPIRWGIDQKGMQAKDENFGPCRRWLAKSIWKSSAQLASVHAWLLAKLGLHKQWVNRLIEPYDTITAVITATGWDNFFHLRIDKDAQPEINDLAVKMKKALEDFTPRQLSEGEWHLPYISEEERANHSTSELLKASVTRCARASYLRLGAETTIEADQKLHDALIKYDKVHASPFEHQAYASCGEFSGNLYGWHQYRKDIPNESV